MRTSGGGPDEHVGATREPRARAAHRVPFAARVTAEIPSDPAYRRDRGRSAAKGHLGQSPARV